MSFHNNSDNQQSYDAVIVGMGPVGLAAAYAAAKNGNRVLLVEKREEKDVALRPQVVVLDQRGKRQLIDMIGVDDSLDESDMKFLDVISDSSEIKLSLVQRFILNRIKNLNSCSKQSGQRVEFSYQSELADVNFEIGSAQLSIDDINDKVNNTVKFRHLIVADGARSPTLTVVNKKLAAENLIHREQPLDLRHLRDRYHLGVYVELSTIDSEDLRLPENEFVSSFYESRSDKSKSRSHHLFFLRFDKKYHAKNKEKKVKLGFIGEIPTEVYDDIAKIENKEEKRTYVKKYVKRIVANYLGVDENKLNIEITKSKKSNKKKDALKILMFQGDGQKANKAARNIYGRGLYLAGDAYFTPNYAVGHGLNDGLESAQQFGELPSENDDISSHQGKYNKLNSSNARSARIVTQAIRWLRKLGITRNYFIHFHESRVASDEKKDKIDLRKSLVRTVKGNEDKVQRFIRTEKFDTATINAILTHDNPRYKVGFLLVDSIEEIPVNQITEIPTIVKTNKFPLNYYLYQRDSEGKVKSQELNCATGEVERIMAESGFQPEDVFKINEIVESPLSVDAAKDLASRHPLIRYITSEMNPSDEKMEVKIEEWELFLTDYPSIVKQYRLEIWDELTKINDLIEKLGGEEIKQKFKAVYEKYETKINEYNQELITMAREHPNKMDESGRAPLYYALQQGDMETIKAILALGVNPNKAVKNTTIFTDRVCNHPELARSLLDAGANPFKPVNNPHSVFYYALTKDFNPGLVIEFLKVCQNPEHRLYNVARKELSTKKLEEIINELGEIKIDQYDRLAIMNVEEVRALLLNVKPNETQRVAELSLFDARVELKDYFITSLEAMRNEIQNKKRLGSKVLSHSVRLFKSGRRPADEPVVAPEIEKSVPKNQSK